MKSYDEWYVHYGCIWIPDPDGRLQTLIQTMPWEDVQKLARPRQGDAGYWVTESCGMREVVHMLSDEAEARMDRLVCEEIWAGRGGSDAAGS